MEETRFRENKKLDDTTRKNGRNTAPTELEQRLTVSREQQAEESSFSVAKSYLVDNFAKQASKLRRVGQINDSDEQMKNIKPLASRFTEIRENLQHSLQAEAFTELERDQLRVLYDTGIAFFNYVSTEMKLFRRFHGVQFKAGTDLSLVTASETQQQLAQFLITRAREASDAAAKETGEVRYLEDTIFPLLHTMAVQALGQERGTHLYNGTYTGVYGLAAAYLMYSDASLNSYEKSFKVFFPSPYLDALEQTDLILFDDSDISESVREEIKNALELGVAKDFDAINSLSPEAKKYIYKIQLKTRYNGGTELTEQDKKDRERFLSSRCHSKGFDKGDFVVFNYNKAREIIAAARKE
ncbi:MAG TPA: hypothetical protein VJL39_00350 [Candidatus Paceibacterota bacterium]